MHGSHITAVSPFGQDPLQSNSSLISQREAEFYVQYPSFADIFHATVNDNYGLFRAGLLHFIAITENLKMLL